MSESPPPVAVTFARPEESRAFRRLLPGAKRSPRGGVETLTGRLGGIEVIVAHTGIGPEAAGRTARALLAGGPLWMMLGAGFAGALDPKLQIGDVVLDERRGTGAAPSRIVSRPRPVESVAEKAALDDSASARGSSGYGSAVAGLQLQVSGLAIYGMYQITTSPSRGKLLVGPTHNLTAGIRFSLGSAKEGITGGGY